MSDVERVVEVEEYDENVTITIRSVLRNEFNIEQASLEQHPHLIPQWQELESLSDHLFPVVVGALIDARLTDLLRGVFVKTEDTDKKKDSTPKAKAIRSLLGGTGLGYIEKVRLVIATGLLPEELFDSLQSIAIIRNHFAHVAKPSYKNQDIKEAVIKLNQELLRIFLLEAFEDDPKGLKDLLDRIKKHIEENDKHVEHEGRVGLRSSWVMLSILMDHSAKKTKRLKFTLKRENQKAKS